MISILILLVTVMFLLAYPYLEGYRDYLACPIKPGVSKQWHHYGFIIRACTANLLILSNQYLGYQYIPLYAFYFWISIDLTIGVGTTAATDKFFGKYSIYIKIAGLILSIVYLSIFVH